jgi:Flp pilus assembly pilin Flp
MQAAHASSQTTWKQAYQEALFELEPKRLRSKLQTAQAAVEARLEELRFAGDYVPREVLDLTDAQHLLRYLQEHELQTWNLRWGGVGAGERPVRAGIRPTPMVPRLRARTVATGKESDMNKFLQFCREEEGQDIAEYAVMLAVILVLVVGTIRLVGSNANNVFSSVASSVQ